MNLSLIVAYSDERAIGRDGDLPWRLSTDLKRFRQLTTGHSIIMGRKTYESINRALPDRRMIVLTRDDQYQAEYAQVATTPAAALEFANLDRQPFVIGGAEVYRAFLPQVSTVYLTRVLASIPDADAFFPEVDWTEWDLVEEQEFPVGPKDSFPTVYQVFQRPGSPLLSSDDESSI